MNRIRRLAALPPGDLLRLLEASAAALAVDACLRLASPVRCLGLVRSGRALGVGGARVDPARLAWLAEVADRHLPGRAGCLRRALTLGWMFARRGIDATVRIGVAREGTRLLAHAWVETADGRAFGAVENLAYAPLPLPTLPLASRAAPR